MSSVWTLSLCSSHLSKQHTWNRTDTHAKCEGWGWFIQGEASMWAWVTAKRLPPPHAVLWSADYIYFYSCRLPVLYCWLLCDRRTPCGLTWGPSELPLGSFWDDFICINAMPCRRSWFVLMPMSGTSWCLCDVPFLMKLTQMWMVQTRVFHFWQRDLVFATLEGFTKPKTSTVKGRCRFAVWHHYQTKIPSNWHPAAFYMYDNLKCTQLFQ